jgi:hypothetical protein
MKLPIASTILSAARLYAIETADHTVNYEGWNENDIADTFRKLERITLGRFGQLWFYEFCQLNGIPSEEDKTNPLISDKTDVRVCGFDVDVKISKIADMPCQISPGVLDKSQIYLFLGCDERLTYIEPKGFISRLKIKENSVFIKHGEKIPNTNFIQKFKAGSYFISNKELKPFFEVVHNLILYKSWHERQAA